MHRMYSPWREVYMQSFKDEKQPGEAGKSVFADLPPEEDEKRFVLYRGKTCFIIMNLYPYNCGHLMVIPYLQTPDLSDLDRETKLEVMELTDLSIKALKRTLRPQGFNVGANMGKLPVAALTRISIFISFHAGKVTPTLCLFLQMPKCSAMI